MVVPTPLGSPRQPLIGSAKLLLISMVMMPEATAAHWRKDRITTKCWLKLTGILMKTISFRFVITTLMQRMKRAFRAGKVHTVLPTASITLTVHNNHWLQNSTVVLEITHP